MFLQFKFCFMQTNWSFCHLNQWSGWALLCTHVLSCMDSTQPVESPNIWLADDHNQYVFQTLSHYKNVGIVQWLRHLALIHLSLSISGLFYIIWPPWLLTKKKKNIKPFNINTSLFQLSLCLFNLHQWPFFGSISVPKKFIRTTFFNGSSFTSAILCICSFCMCWTSFLESTRLQLNRGESHMAPCIAYIIMGIVGFLRSKARH